MSREVFEYFFEPEELEPYYSELRKRHLESKPDLRKVTAPTDTLTEPEEAQETVQVKTQASAASKAAEHDSRSDTGAEGRTKEADVGDKQFGTFPPHEAVSTESGVVPAAPGRTRVRQLLSVHAVGQYVFCARSAILAAEHGDEQDVDEPLPRLTYLPNFDRERIEEVLSKKLRQLAFAVLYGGSMVCLMVAGVLGQNRGLFYPALFVFIICFTWFVSLSATILRLVTRRRAAIKAEAREVDPQVTGIQTVNWWSMLKAGFEPVDYDRPFRHPELALEGCPWRVLERHSQRIPVIRSGGKKLGARDGELYPKHEIRLAAYALLLEVMGHVEVPYGLVFPHDSPRGLALPITSALRKRTLEALEEFCDRLRESQQHRSEPRTPENRKRCENCRHGYPVLLKPAQIESARKLGKQIVVLQGSNGSAYHCDCGNRFGTAPPHGKSIKLGLTASLE